MLPQAIPELSLSYEYRLSVRMSRGSAGKESVVALERGGSAEYLCGKRWHRTLLAEPHEVKKILAGRISPATEREFIQRCRENAAAANAIRADSAARDAAMLDEAHRVFSCFGMPEITLHTRRGGRIFLTRGGGAAWRGEESAWLRGTIHLRHHPWELPFGLSIGNAGLSASRHLSPYAESLEAALSALVDAPPLEKGIYRVVLSPDVASLVAHEAVGHLSEADAMGDPRYLDRCFADGNSRIAPPALTVVDDPLDETGSGHYRHDDQGTPAQRTVIVDKGCFTGRLHDIRTAAIAGAEPTGNARAASPCGHSMVRQSNLVVRGGLHSRGDLLAMVEDGLYIDGGLLGATNGCVALYAREIRNGVLGKRSYGGVGIRASLGILRRLIGVGDDFAYSPKGVCGKQGHFIYAMGRGSPSLAFDAVELAPVPLAGALS